MLRNRVLWRFGGGPLMVSNHRRCGVFMKVRPVAENDWPRIGELSDLLVSTHHAFNPSRFVHPSVLPPHVYTTRVRSEIDRGRAMVRVAEVDGEIAGYVFAGIEPESWKELRHETGYVHDLATDMAHRHGGAGTALVESALEWFAQQGVERIMLWTAQENAAAQRLFSRIGFRATMIEMMFQRRTR
jgi:ribosomal protein S18 acetylase RimI-like enzyme